MAYFIYQDEGIFGSTSKYIIYGSIVTMYIIIQVMSQSVACALEVKNRNKNQQTRIFIRMIDKFFDCLNVKSPQQAKLKRKETIAPYYISSDGRFKV